MKGGLTAANLAKHNKKGGNRQMKRCGGGSKDDESDKQSGDSIPSVIETCEQKVTENLKKVKNKLEETKKFIEDNNLQCSKQEGGFLLKGLTNATKLVKKVGSTAVGATRKVAKGALRGTRKVAKGAMRGTRKVAKGAMRGTRKVAKGAMRGTRKAAKTLKLRGGKNQPSIKH
jgi:hypothetical protein